MVARTLAAAVRDVVLLAVAGTACCCSPLRVSADSEEQQVKRVALGGGADPSEWIDATTIVLLTGCFAVCIGVVLAGKRRGAANANDSSVLVRRLSSQEESERVQTLNTIRSYADEQYVENVSVEWLYQPHTILTGTLILSVLLYSTIAVSPSAVGPDAASVNFVRGLKAAAFVLLMIGLLVFPSGPFIRPHPIVWRFAFGVSVVYELFMVGLLFQSRDDARHALTFLASGVGQPLEEKEYASNCDLTWANVSALVFDQYFVGHFVGWMLKAIVVRDATLCWIMSVLWECIEIALHHLMPNFAECWWDQLILDILLCNGIGIYCGLKVCDYLEHRRYEWHGLKDIPTAVGKFNRIVLQFTPERWAAIRWQAGSSLTRFLVAHLLVLFFELEELNAFFLKHILWVPPENPLNKMRLLLWLGVSLPSVRQLYRYMVDPACKRLGTSVMMAFIVMATELLVIVKFGAGMFPTPMPSHIFFLVVVFVIAYAVFFLMVVHNHLTRPRAGVKKE